MPKSSTPNFTHDCDVCQYLGEYTFDEKLHDLYYCPRSDEGTVIARYGHRGFEYGSMPITILLYAGLKWNSTLVEAAKRQIQRWQHPVPHWSPANLWRR